ncbi:MAG: DUF1461 domain-containing protein [Candidatus Woesearchaeota archaeon]
MGQYVYSIAIAFGICLAWLLFLTFFFPTYEIYQFFAQTPVESEQAIADHQQITYYLLGMQPQLNASLYTQRELIHMQDVRFLFWLAISLVLFIGAVLWFSRQYHSHKVYQKVGILLVGVPFALLFFSIAFFQTVFTWFHKLLFTNDYWLLPTNAHLLGLYPESFFFSFAILWMTSCVATGLLLTGVTTENLKSVVLKKSSKKT